MLALFYNIQNLTLKKQIFLTFPNSVKGRQTSVEIGNFSHMIETSSKQLPIKPNIISLVMAAPCSTLRVVLVKHHHKAFSTMISSMVFFGAATCPSCSSYYSEWFEPRSISSSYCVIVRVSVVLKRTVVGDWRFDNLSGSHLQSQVSSVCQSMLL